MIPHNGMNSINISIKVYLMAILDNYMFRPLHNTSGPEPSNLTLAASTTMPLVRAYHHIQKLQYAIRPYVEISAPRARSMYIVGP